MAFNVKDFPLCETAIERINNKFVDSGWITLYEERVYAVLVTDEVLHSTLNNDGWELNATCSHPSINEDGESAWGYSRCTSKGVEPIVVFQEKKCHHKQAVRLCEEFVLFYDLRIVPQKNDDFDYVMVDEVGDDVLVAKYEAGALIALVKYVKEFMAVKNMNLLVQIDEINYDARTLSTLGEAPREYKLYNDPDCVFGYALNESQGIVSGLNSHALICGKVAFRYNDSDIKLLWNGHEDGYEEFVVGLDENGDEIVSSCEELKLPNLFVWNGKSVYTLTPVYFKREALEKYFSDSEKYSVQDGYISGPGWGVHADTDRKDDLIAISLVDLGRIPYKEQKYWRRYNVAPPKNAKLSDTTMQRWFEGRASDAKNAPDLIFKREYSSLNQAWETRFGWPLFKPLAEGDSYHFESLHVMTSRDNDHEFYGLVQSLTLIVVDSLNEGEIWKNVDQTNAELQAFMEEKSITELSKVAGIKKFELFLVCYGMRNDELIGLWRDIQDLRSSNVAHRKSSNPDSKQRALLARFGLDKQSQQQVFSQLLERVIVMMIWLKEEVEKSIH